MRVTKRDFFKSFAGAFTAPAILKAAKQAQATGQAEISSADLSTSVSPGEARDLFAGSFDTTESRQWDTVKLPKGWYLPQNVPFFAAPVGTRCLVTGRFKDGASTSMYWMHEFPVPWHVVVRSIGLYISTENEDVLRILGSGSLEFNILHRFYYRAPLVCVMERGKPDLTVRSDAKPRRGYGWLIAPQIYFGVDLRYPEETLMAADAELTVVMDTTEARPTM